MIRKWLQRRVPEPVPPPDGKQITKMTREQLGSITPEVIDFESLSKADQAVLLSSASRVFAEPAFKQVLSDLIGHQVNYIAKSADVDSQLQNYMGRFSINGIALVLEEFERLDNAYRDSLIPKDLINQEDIIWVKPQS